MKTNSTSIIIMVYIRPVTLSNCLSISFILSLSLCHDHDDWCDNDDDFIIMGLIFANTANQTLLWSEHCF